MNDSNGDKPIYQSIIEYIDQKIQCGEFKPSEKLPTEMELAAQFNCSRITSKKALEVLENKGLIYRRKGSGSFVALQQASSVEESNVKHIAMVLDSSYEQGDLLGCINGASEFLETHNCVLNVVRVNQADGDLDRTLNKLSDEGASGIIYYPLSDRKAIATVNMIASNGMPIVTIDKRLEGSPISSVVSDNEKGCYELTKLMIEKGHKKIAFLSNVGIEEATSVKNRFLGYLKALKENDIYVDGNLVELNYNDRLREQDSELYELSTKVKPLERPGQYEFYFNMVKKLLKHGATTIICVNDVVAMYVMKACITKKIEIPKDICITGFDDTFMSRHLEIPITTVKQDMFQMGHLAAKLITDQIDNEDMSIKNEVLPVKIVERESTNIRK